MHAVTRALALVCSAVQTRDGHGQQRAAQDIGQISQSVRRDMLQFSHDINKAIAQQSEWTITLLLHPFLISIVCAAWGERETDKDREL